jgi:quinol monooxygenase YgiN/predicted enzyme related to lactoylglutathione lyase
MTAPSAAVPVLTAGTSHADHVALRVADYDESVLWYQQVLGATVRRQWTLAPFPGVRFAYLDFHGFTLEIVGDGSPAPGPRPRDVPAHLGTAGLLHLCLQVDGVTATVERLRAHGVDVLADPFDVPEIDRRLALVVDNSGNILELSEPLTQPHAGPGGDDLVVLAVLAAAPAHVTTLGAALLAMVAPSRAEPGCLGYDLHQGIDDPATFVIHERWTTADELKEHFETPHFLSLTARLDDLLARPMTIYRLTASPKGQGRP